MVPEFLLSSLFSAAGSTVGYVVYAHLRERRYREVRLRAEIAEREAAVRVEREAREEQERCARKERERAFRPALLQELRRQPAASFRFATFVERRGVDRAFADDVARAVFLRVAASAVADGVITEAERAKLDALRGALALDPTHAGRIEQEVKEEHYRGAVAGALADGVLTESEGEALKSLRRSLGLGDGAAFRSSEPTIRLAYLDLFRKVAEDRTITEAERWEMLRFRDALAITDEQAGEIIRDEAVGLYAECVEDVLEAGEVTAEEERRLAWVQQATGLRDGDVGHHHLRIRRAKRLSGLRRGELPTLATSLALKKGETCHWMDRCDYEYATTTRTKRARGALVVTSRSVRFTSPSKSITFPPARVADVHTAEGRAEILVDGRSGAGTYFVADPEELAAVLIGVLRTTNAMQGLHPLLHSASRGGRAGIKADGPAFPGLEPT